MPLRFLTAGESHGPSLTAILDGMPAGLPITADIINKELARRQQGYGSGGRMKIDSAWTMGGTEKLKDASVTKMASKMKIDVVQPKEGEDSGLAPGMKTTITDGKGDGECYFDAKAGQLANLFMGDMRPLILPIDDLGGGNRQGAKTCVLDEGR